MPRVSNDQKSFANRMIEKVVTLRSEIKKYEAVRANVAKLPEKDPTIEVLTDYMRKIEADRDSLITTILGMHEKMITSDFSTFVKFASELALQVANDSDANHAKMLKEAGVVAK